MREAYSVEEEKSGCNEPFATGGSPAEQSLVHVASGCEATAASVQLADVAAEGPQQPPVPTSADPEGHQTSLSATFQEPVTEVRLQLSHVCGWQVRRLGFLAHANTAPRASPAIK